MANLNFLNRSVLGGVPPEQSAEYLRIPAAQQKFGLSRTRLYVLAGQKQIRMIKVGGATLVDCQSVRDYLAAQPCADIRTK